MEDKLNCLADAALESELNSQLISCTNTFAADKILHKYFTYVYEKIRNSGKDSDKPLIFNKLVIKKHLLNYIFNVLNHMYW